MLSVPQPCPAMRLCFCCSRTWCQGHSLGWGALTRGTGVTVSAAWVVLGSFGELMAIPGAPHWAWPSLEEMAACSVLDLSSREGFLVDIEEIAPWEESGRKPLRLVLPFIFCLEKI